MVSRVRRCEIVDILLDGTISAFDQYFKITEVGVSCTPEYWYSSMLTIALSKRMNEKGLFPVLEESLDIIREEGKSGNRGPVPKALRRSGKTDIALWRYKYRNDEWMPHSLIEVKRGWNWDNARFPEDIKRLRSALNNFGKKNEKGTLEAGFFVIVTDSWKVSRNEAIEKFEAQLKDINKQISKLLLKKNCVHNGYLKYGKYNNTEKSIGAAMVFKIM